MKKRTWYRLDNAAKIYPAVSNSRRSGVFALSAILTEKIDKNILNDAVNVVLHRFPTFKVKLKRGVFWYYLEENKKPFFVEEEVPYFLEYINETCNNDYLFRVFYYNNKITLAIFHALADGSGGLEVLKAIIFEYLLLSGKKLKADNELKTIYSPATDEEIDDIFLKVYNKNIPKPKKEVSAFRINGTHFAVQGNGLITAKIKVEQLKALSKKHNATITAFLTGLITHLIYQNHVKNQKVKNKNIKVLVPVNLRKLYKANTIRNFALFTRTSCDYMQKEHSLEEVVEICSNQLKEGTQKEVLESLIASHVKTEKNPLLKMAPLFLKDLAMQLAYTKVGDNLHTTSFSNLGIVTLPDSVKEYVSDFIFTLGTSYSCKYAVAAISYDNFLNITFSREFVETKIEKDFVRYLTENNIDAELSSNYWEEN